MSVGLNRRQFLGAMTAAAAAGSLSPSEAAEGSLLKTVKNMQFVDQQGRKFPLADKLQEPCIVLFGYGGCPLCEEITKVVATTQEKMLDAGIKNVPIIVISNQPEQDRSQMGFIVGKYHNQHVYQFPNKAAPGVAANFNADERILHVLCPPNKDAAKALQRAIADEAGVPSGLNSADDRQHTRYLFLCNNGAAQKKPYEGAKLDRKTGEFNAPESLINDESARLVTDLKNLLKTREKPGNPKGRSM